jgi:hypothetical protein
VRFREILLDPLAVFRRLVRDALSVYVSSKWWNILI